MAGPKWPHDHAAKHAAAARKGWATRKRSGFGMTSEGVIVPHKTAQPVTPSTTPHAALTRSPNATRTMKRVAEQEARIDQLVRRASDERDLNHKAYLQTVQSNEREKLAVMKARLAKTQGRKLAPGEAYLTAGELARGLGSAFGTSKPAKPAKPAPARARQPAKPPVKPPAPRAARSSRSDIGPAPTKPAKTKRPGADAGYEAWRKDFELARHLQPGAAYRMILEHRAYAARWRREHPEARATNVIQPPSKPTRKR